MPSSLFSNSFRCLIVLAALSLFGVGPAGASWFSKDKPIPDWGLEAAKTKTPEYAKDSAAVILYDEYVETIDDQGRATERERVAIRILKPQGRHRADCRVSYDVDEKINYFRVWTIGADEKQYPAQDTDFADVGDLSDSVMLSTHKRRVVHPPAADVGATIICESEELLAPYQQEAVWEFQNSIPFVFQALEVDLPPGRAHAEAWHRFPPVKPVEVAPNHWRWELKDVHALDLRDLKSPPDWTALAARMSVHWGDAAVEGKDNQWKALGQRYTKLEADRPAPSRKLARKPRA